MIGCMGLHCVMMLRIAAADMCVSVGLLVSPLGSVEIVVVVECSVRDLGKGVIVHVKQLAAKIALLISVPAFFRAVRGFFRNGLHG